MRVAALAAAFFAAGFLARPVAEAALLPPAPTHGELAQRAAEIDARLREHEAALGALYRAALEAEGDCARRRLVREALGPGQP